ncbi:MAG: DUF4296 domain-containing protein [Bacteroidota bacterium]
MNRIWWFAGILLIIFITGCRENAEPVIPSDIIAKDRMAGILIDMHLADAMLINLQLDKSNEKFNAENYYDQVLEKHGVTREDVEKSVSYYARIPDYYDKIYDDVVAGLSKMSDDIIAADSLSRDTSAQEQP